MFQVTMGPSSGETTVFMRHLILVWYAGAYALAYQTVIHTE